MLTATQLPSNPLVGLIVAAVLFGIGRVIIRRVAYAEGDPWLVKILTFALVLHLVAAPTQIFVVDHVYHGVADWTQYTHVGSYLAGNFRHFDFTLAGANIRAVVNDGSVSISAGVVMAIVGSNLVATFLVFSWLSFIGTIFFFRAFSLTFKGGDHRRYARMLFFLPSLIFWTADVSKESIMMLSLGLTAYGSARILAKKPGGFAFVVPGAIIGYYIRPNELLLALAGFVVALMVPSVAAKRSFGALRRIVTLAILGGLLVISLNLTQHDLGGGSGGSINLQQINANNGQGSGLGYGSSGVAYSNDPITYPRDVYTVLADPLPINAHGNGERVAAAENLVIIALILISLRNLRMVPRATFARPYLMVCLVYTGAFFYTFAALGNLGLIERERTMMLPYMLALLCVPRGPKRQPPRYDWELRRKTRVMLRAMAERRAAEARRNRSRPGPPIPSTG